MLSFGARKKSAAASRASTCASKSGRTNGWAGSGTGTPSSDRRSRIARLFCAYHSATSSSVGNVAFTNLPYITDAGGNCGADFNGLGPDAGITIVGGHEMAETMTDQFPSGGWVDSSGAENGDKCAWIPTGQQGAAAKIILSSGTFAVQSLWSNAFNTGSGGCVLSYP